MGIDFNQCTASALKTRSEFFTSQGIEVRSVVPNLVDLVWGEDRPARPINPVTAWDMKYAGVSSLDKQAKIASKLSNAEYEALLVTTLDDICWLTNLRGTDITFNPVFFAYALFYPKRSAEECRLELFIRAEKVE